jgi:alginate O-acetyltransferase complex protein AlgI
MLFNSLQFVLFFIITTCLYFALPQKRRWFLLLTASCWFYMAFIPAYLLILGLTIVIDYIAGIYIEKSEGQYRKYLLIISLISNIGILGFFKYYNFFALNLNELSQDFGNSPVLSLLNIALPIGLSFHTFQAMSYTIEVYRGNQKAEKHFGIYALYVMFYPQLVAGPIERPQNMLHQFHEYHEWNFERFKSGLMIIMWGLFKKIVIADRLALLVNQTYDHAESQTSLNLLLATVLFSFQIYFDFSAYSEIALGTARVMGFKLMENFRTPYFSGSISEFWSRWHISLSSWFKDYVYIPLGGNRVSVPRWYFNLFFVFLLSGFWHGANWGFIIWGALHGVYLIAAILRNRFFPNLPKLPKALQILTVFVLVTFSWIFFRAATFTDSAVVIAGIAKGDWRLENYNVNEIIYCFALIIFICLREKYDEPFNPSAGKNWYLTFLILLIAIYFLGIFNENQFIYFQF